jgi:hypothetical protein
VLRGAFDELLVAGDGSREGEEGQEVAGVTFVAQGQPPVAGQPGERSFDDPPVPAELVTGLDAFAGDADGDAAVAEPGAQVSLVIGLVRVQLGRLAAARAAAGPDRGDGPDRGVQREGVAGVRG